MSDGQVQLASQNQTQTSSYDTCMAEALRAHSKKHSNQATLHKCVAELCHLGEAMYNVAIVSIESEYKLCAEFCQGGKRSR